MLRVHHLGMELHGIETLCGVIHRRDGADGCARRHVKAVRQSADVVRMTHPADIRLRYPLKERRRGVDDLHLRTPVLARRRRLHASTAEMRHQLRTVADTEHGDTEGKEILGGGNSPLAIDTVRTARQDNTARSEFTNLLQWQRMRMHLAVDMVLTHAARDELIVLSAKVQHQDHFCGIGSVHLRSPSHVILPYPRQKNP